MSSSLIIPQLFFNIPQPHADSFAFLVILFSYFDNFWELNDKGAVQAIEGILEKDNAKLFLLLRVNGTVAEELLHLAMQGQINIHPQQCNLIDDLRTLLADSF